MVSFKYTKLQISVVLYVCQTWSLINGGTQTRGVFENRVLRRTHGHKGEEVSEGQKSAVITFSIVT
jgi:hypothetical protein